MSKPKYIVVYDPLSYTGHGSFMVKENNEMKTPYCVVFIPFGNKETAKQYAKAKAKKIAEALDFKDRISEAMEFIKSNKSIKL